MDIIAEALYGCFWVAETVLWIVVTLMEQGVMLIWEVWEYIFFLLKDVAPDVFRVFYSTGEGCGKILIPVIFSLAEYGSHFVVFLGSQLSYVIIYLPQLALTSAKFLSSLLYGCGQFVVGTLGLFLSFTSILLNLLLFSMLTLAVVLVILCVCFVRYQSRRVTRPCRRTTTVRAQVFNQPQPPVHVEPRQPSIENEEEEHIDTGLARPVLHQRSNENRSTVQELEGEHLRRRLSQLSDELTRERDRSMCVVCLDAKREVLLKPCKHFCLCGSCARIRTIQRCPMCNQRIRSSEKIFNV